MFNNVSAISQAAQSVGNQFVVASEVARINQGSAANHNYKLTGHQKLYAHLRDIYAFVKEVHKNPVHDGAWSSERVIRQVHKPKEGQNEFAQYYNVLDGFFDTSKTVTFGGVQGAKWVRGRSSEKYARLLRWLYENNIEVEDVVRVINNFVHTDGKTKIEGIRQADIDRHAAKPRAKKTWRGTVKQDALAAPRSYEIPMLAVDGFTTHDGFGTLVFRVHDGKVHLFCDAGPTADAIVKVVSEQMTKPKGNEEVEEAEPTEEALAA